MPKYLRKSTNPRELEWVKRSPKEEETIKRHLNQLRTVSEDQRGFKQGHLGKTFKAGTYNVHMAMLTYHREGDRAFMAAKEVEDT